jgi:Gpi18-like mannosyltransferase
MQIFVVWFIFRILTSLSALLASPLRKLTELERTVPVWPPSSPFSPWLTRILLAPFERWDAEWYIRIIATGYGHGDGTAQFHPLYPWIASIFYELGLSPLLSLMIVGSAASLALFFLFYRLARLDLNHADAITGLLFFAISPTAFILYAPYPEGLFLLCSVACIYWARQRKWWLASLAAGLAVLTRQQGVLLIFPLLWEFFDAYEFQWKNTLKAWRHWLSFSLIPLALMVWIIYRAVFLSDVQADFSNVNSLIYSVFISPNADKVVPEQAFLLPWQTIGLMLEKVINAPDLDVIVNLVGGLFFILMLILAWPYMRMSYCIYCLVIFLVSFSYYTGSLHPTMGLLRHLMLAFPIFIGLPLALRKPVLRLSWAAVSGLFMFFLLGLYVFESWVV